MSPLPPSLVVTQLRNRARRSPAPESISGFGYMTWAYVVISARLESILEWYEATDTERRMFMFFVADDLETFNEHWRTQVESANSRAERAEAALQELVRLKTLKDSLEAWVRDDVTGEQWPAMQPMAARDAAAVEYNHCKPLAWAAARTVVEGK